MKKLPVGAFIKSNICQLCSNQNYARRHQSRREDKSVKLSASFSDDDFLQIKEISHLAVDSLKFDAEDVVKEEKVKSLQTELSLLKERDGTVPQRLSLRNWEILLKLKSSQERENYLHNLWWLGEYKKQCRKKVNEAINREIRKTNIEKGPIIRKGDERCVKYGLNHNSLLRSISQTKMNKYYYYRLLKAEMFGPNIVVDCAYDKDMDDRELHKCVRDIFQMWQQNKIHANPFNLLFCNLDETSLLFRKIRNAFLDFENPYFPFTHTSKSYLDLHEKKNIIYLSPYSTNHLLNYDCNRIYVIGALMNNKERGPVSLSTIRREGLQNAKFPISHFVNWNYGSNSLTPSKTLAIMNDLKERCEWRTIFKQHLPVKETPQQRARRHLESD